MITVDHLTKRYRTLTAVDGLSFDVGPGRVTGFLGPNGAGKTTMLRMVLGLAAPTSGTATINGTRYRDLRNPVRSLGGAAGAARPAGGALAFPRRCRRGPLRCPASGIGGGPPGTSWPCSGRCRLVCIRFSAQAE